MGEDLGEQLADLRQYVATVVVRRAGERHLVRRIEHGERADVGGQLGHLGAVVPVDVARRGS